MTLKVTRNQGHKKFERFCSDLDLFLSRINNQHPSYSFVKDNFNNKWKNCEMMMK